LTIESRLASGVASAHRYIEFVAIFRLIRKDVLEGMSSVDLLRSKAEVIAARSESLSNMMARELRQLDRLLVSEVAEP